MSFEQEIDVDYSYSKEYDQPEANLAKPIKGRNPSKNERRQARKAKIEERRHNSNGNSNNLPGTDPLARTSRAGGRQPGFHGH